MSKKKDIEFLEEMRERLAKAPNDPTEFERLRKMIEDWISELKGN